MLAFVRVVESGGFTSAAQRLGLSVSAVTKNVSRLETDLGAQLLTRTTRRITVTDFGREYYASCRKVLSEIENVENALKQSQQAPRGKVTLLCPMFFARINLLPRIGEFYARYPEVEVEVRFGSRYDDITEEGINLAVVVGQLTDSRFASRTLTRSHMLCAATPDYLERHGTPRTIDDLLSHNCLVSRSALWQFKESGRTVELAVKGNLVVREGDALREATLLGLGIARSNWWLFRQDIADGTLIEVLKPHRVPGRPISVIYPPTRFLPKKIRVMIDFLVEITKTDGA
ncbi:MAG TPA: LysR family transcriptional regulator, partial [Burkholderiales bacterium]|nr:LysR family transcriptional regulator [Burkholderiales bacterium]